MDRLYYPMIVRRSTYKNTVITLFPLSGHLLSSVIMMKRILIATGFLTSLLIGMAFGLLAWVATSPHAAENIRSALLLR
jgi:hypothetical protein